MTSKYGGQYKLLNCTTTKELVEAELSERMLLHPDSYPSTTTSSLEVRSFKNEMERLNRMTLAQVQSELDCIISKIQTEHQRKLSNAKEALHDTRTLLLKLQSWKAPSEGREIKASLLKKLRDIETVWEKYSIDKESEHLKALKARSPKDELEMRKENCRKSILYYTAKNKKVRSQVAIHNRSIKEIFKSLET